MRQGAASTLLLAASLMFTSILSLAQDSAGARKVLIKTAPIYPTVARSMNIHGVARIEAVVSPSGTVKSVTVKGGHPMLAQSAATAVGHWKFEPAAHETKELIEVKFDPE